MLSVLLSFFLTTPAQALPINPCNSGLCSDKHQQILMEFEQGQPPRLQNSRVYSGKCFHFSPNHSPEHTHYGVALLEKFPDSLNYAGRFRFFGSGNPYEEWSLENARLELPKASLPERALQINEDYAFIDFTVESDTPLMYWMKTNADESKLILLGLWGRYHTLMCEFRSH